MQRVAGRARAASIDRVGTMDLTVLASDRGSVPMNIGAVLVFDRADCPSPADVRKLLAERLPAVPRLRQRLDRAPVGCGRPFWVDDTGFDLDRHLTAREWPSPPGIRQLLDVAADLVCQPLDRRRPLWRACLLTDPAGEQAALQFQTATRAWLGMSRLTSRAAPPRRHPGQPVALARALARSIVMLVAAAQTPRANMAGKNA